MMSESTTTNERVTTFEEVPLQAAARDKPVWQTPTIEDVSEQVMAQPYIRFT
jgi:hypothetical protein